MAAAYGRAPSSLLSLVLFKHHDPLAFTHTQLYDFLAVSDGWFAAAAAAHAGAGGGGGGGADGGGGNAGCGGAALHPFFIWNCGPRCVCVWWCARRLTPTTLS